MQAIQSCKLGLILIEETENQESLPRGTNLYGEKLFQGRLFCCSTHYFKSGVILLPR